MADVNIKINGKDYQGPEGITVLEAARMANITCIGIECLKRKC